MDAALGQSLTMSAQDREIAATVRRERPGLLAFIRRRIADAAEAEDVLQEAFYELVAAYRMLEPIEQAGAWLKRVARNRIIDRLRRGRRELPVPGPPPDDPDADEEGFDELLPPRSDDPESALMRARLLEELQEALEELPAEQRAVFLAHEIEGVSFRELAARTGVGVNTLLARKRYALLHLRRRLAETWNEWLLG